MYDSYHPKLVRKRNGLVYFVIDKRTHAGPETEYETVFEMPYAQFLLGIEKDAVDVAHHKNIYWPKFGNLG